MKRVLVIVPSLGTGGGEKMAIDIASHLNHELFETMIVSLYSREDGILTKYAEDNGLRVKYLSKSLGTDFHVISDLRRVVKEFHPDIIQTHLYVVPYVLLSTPRKIKKYHTVHNIAEKEAEGKLRVIMRIAYSIGNFTPIAISPFCAKSFEHIYHIPSEKIACIVNGVDIHKFTPKKINHHGIKFICVGRLYPQKNHKMLIEAFNIVHNELPETKLEIVGEGFLREELENIISDYNLDNSVIMNGESNKIGEKLNESDIYVMSSDYEGLPVSVLEAMACGLPIVCTSAGGTTDIVINQLNGIVVPVGDKMKMAAAMICLAKDELLRINMGEASRELAEEYSIEKCAMNYEKVYLNGER